MIINDIITEIEKLAPLSYQESYDNSGLNVGNRSGEATGALLCFDVTEAIVDEAIAKNINLIISHHPVIFNGLKSLSGKSQTERIVIKAIKNNISLYSSHTNLDSVEGGINTTLAGKLGLKNIEILSPLKNKLLKITIFVPLSHADKVRESMFSAGAGNIGNYDMCSYNTNGYGTFRAGQNTQPYVGSQGHYHSEEEIAIQTIATVFNIDSVIEAALKAHPYEVPAYDIYPLQNKLNNVGLGAIGDLAEEVEVRDFLNTIKTTLGTQYLRYSRQHKNKIRKIALCGGSGASFLNDAIYAGADLFLTGDCKYHQFADAENRIILVDSGHFESECFAVEIFYDVINKKFPNFAVRSENISNPVKYF